MALIGRFVCSRRAGTTGFFGLLGKRGAILFWPNTHSSSVATANRANPSAVTFGIALDAALRLGAARVPLRGRGEDCRSFRNESGSAHAKQPNLQLAAGPVGLGHEIRGWVRGLVEHGRRGLSGGQRRPCASQDVS